MSGFAPEFDLDALLKDADEDALAGLADAKSSKSVAMLKGGFAQEQDADASVKLMGEEEDIPYVFNCFPNEHSCSDEALLCFRMDDEPEADVSTVSVASKKRKADGLEETEVVSVAPKKKAVTFSTSQTSKMFDADEAPVASNKAIRAAAKKEKKQKAKKAKASSGDIAEEAAAAAAEPEDEMDSLTRNLEARTKSFKLDDAPEAEEDETYDFQSFFGFKGGKSKFASGE